MRQLEPVIAGQNALDETWKHVGDVPGAVHTEEVTGSIPVSPIAGQRPGTIQVPGL
jgi:hypothetical protein